MGNSKIVYYGETLIDLTGDTVEAAKLLKGVTAHDKKGEKVTGTLSDVTQATPAITVDAAGKITASATQAAGVVAAGTKSATKQLTVQAAKTVTPSASAQTAVAKGVFTTGIITVAAVYAIIGVTYPSGSTVTCTNGSKTLKAKDTSGKAAFVIPSAGTWTVKAVKGSQSASEAVKITTEGQVKTVVLAYDLILFDGTDNTAVTGGLKLQRGNGAGAKVTNVPIVDGKIAIHNGTGYVGIYPANKADITKYSTLYVDLYCGADLQYISCAGIISANVTTVMDTGAGAKGYFVARQDFAKGTNSLTIPVDSLSGKQQFMLMYYAPYGGDFSVSNVRFA